MEISSDWQETIASIVRNPGVVMVIGGLDTGKTTFARLLVNAGIGAGIPTAVVDADTGQSEVGPPSAICLATVDEPVESLRDLRARRLYFVGSTTPVGHFVPTIIGTKRMADEAVAKGSKLVVVDTSGLVKGAIGRNLKLQKAELLGPSHVVGIQEKRELDPILTSLSKIEQHTLHRLQVSSEARSKPREFRMARRRTQFYDYFRNADRHIIRLEDIVCWGTFFTTGRMVKWQHHRVLERALRARVLHAEVVDSGMYIVADCRPDMAGVAGLMAKYNSREFTVVCGTDFSNVLVGLSDSNGIIVGLGIIEAIDFKQRHMSIITPAKSIAPVRVVRFGSMRIRPDGTELGRIKPGEI